MRLSVLVILLLFSVAGMSQSSYSGHLGKYPITVVMYHYGDGVSRAFYAYEAYDTPIIINGRLEDGQLNLFEKDSDGKISATLSFKDFNETDTEIKGHWTNADQMKTYDISLTKDFEINYGEDIEWTSKELLQSASTKNHYFKTIITKEKDDFYARVSGVKIFEKKTDRLIQTIELDCQLMGIDNVDIGDFNFDGHEDFSVFESSAAGPNTSSVYILRNPDSEQYEVSNFGGSSLYFDEDLKLISEHNQCCAGSSHMYATYKVVNNEMVLVEQKCTEYDEETEDFIETDCD